MCFFFFLFFFSPCTSFTYECFFVFIYSSSYYWLPYLIFFSTANSFFLFSLFISIYIYFFFQSLFLVMLYKTCWRAKQSFYSFFRFLGRSFVTMFFAFCTKIWGRPLRRKNTFFSHNSILGAPFMLWCIYWYIFAFLYFVGSPVFFSCKRYCCSQFCISKAWRRSIPVSRFFCFFRRARSGGPPGPSPKHAAEAECVVRDGAVQEVPRLLRGEGKILGKNQIYAMSFSRFGWKCKTCFGISIQTGRKM